MCRTLFLLCVVAGLCVLAQALPRPSATHLHSQRVHGSDQEHQTRQLGNTYNQVISYGSYQEMRAWWAVPPAPLSYSGQIVNIGCSMGSTDANYQLDVIIELDSGNRWAVRGIAWVNGEQYSWTSSSWVNPGDEIEAWFGLNGNSWIIDVYVNGNWTENLSVSNSIITGGMDYAMWVLVAEIDDCSQLPATYSVTATAVQLSSYPDEILVTPYWHLDVDPSCSHSAAGDRYSATISWDYLNTIDNLCIGPIYEYQEASITCPYSTQVISSVQFASFGTPSGTCGNFELGGCDLDTSQSIFESLCLNKQSCSFLVTADSTFTDPCWGQQKYFIAQYTCAVPATICAGPIEENENVNIYCPSPEQEIISVEFASYGTPSGSCGSFEKGSCDSGVSLTKFQNNCLNQTQCSFTVNNDMFGDPCPGDSKNFVVQVTCA